MRFLEFLNNNYHTNQMVFCSVGNIKFEKLIRYFNKYFGDIPSNPRTNGRKIIPQYNQIEKSLKKRTYQAHCIIGNKAFSIRDDKRMNLVLLNNLLGGPGMNSRLNLSLREKHGLVYNIESNYGAYEDTGLFSIYFGTEKENLNKSIDLVRKELKLLKTKKMGVMQLQRAKKQIIGQIAISADSHANLLFTLGKSYLIFNEVDSLETISKKINEITAEDILDTANEIFDDNETSVLIYK